MSGLTVTAYPLSKFLNSYQRSQELFGKDARAIDAFKAEVAQVVYQLITNPLLGDLESYPSSVEINPKFEFRKHDFGVKKLRGAIVQWRIMYFRDLQERKTYLLWVYSRKEYPKRPSSNELRAEIKKALEELNSPT